MKKPIAMNAVRIPNIEMGPTLGLTPSKIITEIATLAGTHPK